MAANQCQTFSKVSLLFLSFVFTVLHPFNTAAQSQEPRASISPINVKVLDGGTASFLCRATGSPTPQISWYKSGVRLATDKDYLLINVTGGGIVLRIELADNKRDSGEFECRAGNGIGKVSVVVSQLDVYPQGRVPFGYPRIVEHPTVKQVDKNENVTLTCSATGTPPVNFNWLQDYAPVDASNKRIKILPTGSLEINSAIESDEGRYQCIAENSIGTAFSFTAQLYLRVRRTPPSFSIPPEGVEVIPGGSVNLTCVAVGSPMPYVKWRKGAEELSPEDNIPIGKNVLVLTNIHQSATYTCVASSDLGSVDIDAEIKVKDLPKSPTSVVIADVTSDSIRLEWKAGTADSPESYVIQYRVKNGKIDSFSELTDIITTYHTITGLLAFTTYEIQVLTTNSIGRSAPSSSVEATTMESAPGSAPRNVRGKPESMTSINLQWEEPKLANGIITGYRVYRTLTPYLPVSLWSVQRVDNVHQTLITSLVHNRTYTIAVLAFTAVGDGPPSENIEVRTQLGVPGQPQNLTGEIMSDTSVQLSWEIPEVSGGERIISYTLYYKDVSGSAGEQSFQKIVISPPTNIYVLKDLAPKTSYNVKVTAVSSRGEGVASSTVVVKTLDSARNAEPLTIHGEAVDSTSIRITWNERSSNQQQRHISGYKVYYALSSANRNLDNDMFTTVPATERSHVIRGLKKWTSYRFRVCVYTQSGDGPLSKPIEVQTAEDLPGVPKRVRAEGINSTAIRVQWRPPADDQLNGVIRGYQVHYAMSDNNEGSPKVQDIMNATATDTVIGNLQADSEYQIQVAALTRKGDGERSKMRKIKTMPIQGSNLSAPRNLKVTPSHSDLRSVTLSWQPPIEAEFGPTVLEYKVEWGTDNTKVEQAVVPGTRTTFSAQSLDLGVEYEFRVSARSSRSYTEEAVESFMMAEGAPTGAPQNASAVTVTTSSVHLQWYPPPQSMRNGEIVLYEVQYTTSLDTGDDWQGANVTETRTVIGGLDPTTAYSMRVRAYTSIGCGPWSDSIPAYTLAIPSKTSLRDVPTNIIVERIAADAMRVAWTRPIDLINITGYRVYYSNSVDTNVEDWLYIETGLERTVHISPLNPQWGYFVIVRTKFGGNTFGPLSEIASCHPEGLPVSIQQAFGNDYALQAEMSVAPDVASMHLLFVLVPICISVVLVLLIILIIVYIRKRRRSRKLQRKSRPVSKALLTPVDTSFDKQDLYELHPRINFNTQAIISHPPIPIANLAEHIELLKANDREKFAQEYESIEPGQTFTWDASNAECNVAKNRYANVIAYDHSRVVLQNNALMGGGADYINANYMDGYCRQGAYIATQGPLPETFADFWLMVWERTCHVIVMMTKLEERNRIKCDQYWPEHGTVVYGAIQVTAEDVLELATYTMRSFTLTRNNSVETRKIHQFQFTAWPDNGVPDHPTPLLQFIRRVKALTPQNKGPVVVHCSAGVGRTGVFIVIDTMLDQIKNEETIDVYWHVTCLRAQRNYMVQTVDQYVFIHDALLEAAESGESEVPADHLYVHVQHLTQFDPMEGCTKMELEFKKLSKAKVDASKFESANLPVNKPKNRLVNILPYDATRVCLQMIRGVEGSDYINANFIDGYQSRRAYIATQGPMENTVDDFWRMLWENSCTVVVMMTKLQEMGREKCFQYWPEERSEKHGYLVVDPMTQFQSKLYICREFKVTDARDGQSSILRHFQFTDWPEQGVPNSGEGFIEFIGQVQKVRDQCVVEGPITVHCSAGFGRTGVFIALSIVLERMQCEGVIDMYQTINMLRTQRPGMVQTEEQYAFCHRAALEYLSSFDHFGNSFGSVL